MKQLVALTTAFLTTSWAYAQGPADFRLGIKAGSTYSSISGKGITQLAGPANTARRGDYQTGYHAGLTLSIPLSSNGVISLNPELLYNRRGYGLNFETERTGYITLNGTTFEVKNHMRHEQQRRLHYLDLPVLARINAGKLFFEAGPQMSYLLASRLHQSSTSTTVDSREVPPGTPTGGGSGPAQVADQGERFRGDLSRVEVGVVAGVGYQTAGGLSVGLRYQHGLSSIRRRNASTDQQPVYTQAATLQVGYVLPLGNK